MEPLASSLIPNPSPAAPRLVSVSAPVTQPHLSVVIVNYHQWPNTRDLVQKLRASSQREGSVEIIIVDNHSPTHPILPSLRRLPGVSLRRWRRNRGFARAVNEGVRLSQGEWVLLLNPDVTVTHAFLEQVVALSQRLATEEPTAGVVGFQLCNPDGSRQLSAGWFPTLAGTLTRMLLPRSRRKYTAPPLDRRSRVDWVTGCCLLARRVCWEQMGGLDGNFFLYYEDVDFCRRAQAAGWSVWYEPALSVVHHHPLHARAVPAHLRLVTRHALLTYARKHWPIWQTHALAGVIAAEAWLQRCRAQWRGDANAAWIFGELQAIAGDFASGRPAAAEPRLLHVVRRQEKRRASTPVDHHSQS
ncbi:MAG TPA: glycosyltransferase family 2 protein [Gemmataceae bacterium]|nr:glycosyltransferase family 2 protein [Gemmataceae bacterium]